VIAASVRPRFARWFAHRAERRLASRFDRVRISGLSHLRSAARTSPVLAIANHSAWWDGVLALWLSRAVLDLDAYAMMDADNLLRHPYFARVGAFGVHRGSRRDGAAALRYAADLLRSPGRCVWVFPQGEERPWHERLVFRPGVARLSRLAPSAAIVPIAFGYSFGATEGPDAWIAIGQPVASTVSAAIQDAVEAERNRILRGIEGREPFEDRLTAKHELALAERMLAWISGIGLRDDAPTLAHDQRALAPTHAAHERGAHPHQK
jgi:1-acyl-sn-glycerol-3-phosphate acyltransferase